MLLFDKPLSELMTYTGTNPCPSDFDAYWDRAVAEMEALGTDFERVPAPLHVPGMDLYEIYFTGVHGSRVHGRLAVPHASHPLPAVLLFHGYSGNCGNFMEVVKYAGCGFVAASMSCRGQGGLSEDLESVQGNTLHGHIIRGLDDPDPEKLYFRQVFLDTAQLARIIMAMPETDPARVMATGASQGGGLTLACAALTPTLKAAAPLMAFLSDYQRVWEMELAQDAYYELQEYFRHMDPRHEREHEIFEKLGYIDVHHLARRIRADILMFTGLSDKICPPSTQFAAYNAIPGHKRMVRYPDFGHEYYPDGDDMILDYFLHMAGLC